MAQPALKNYLSVTEYLQDYYHHRKSQNPGFSYEAWAAELGFKSRSFLKMIVDRKRNITSAVAETLAAAMELDPSERSYFQLLVNYSQAEEPAQKELFMEKIFEQLGQAQERQEILHYQEFLSSKELPKLLVLLSFKDLDKTPTGLAEFLRRPEADIVQSLARLQAMGLAHEVPEGSLRTEWQATKKSFKVPKNFGCLALENYHNHCLQEAIQAQKLAPHLRRYRSLLLPLSAEDYTKLLGDIESLVAKTVAKYDSDSLVQKRLYKMNLNLIPVTETLEVPFTDLRAQLDFQASAKSEILSR
jgi:uncharacterized protein (TIGR02147 family)